MRSFRDAGLFLVTAALATTPCGQATAQADRLPFDTPTMVNGIEAVCTGVGVGARADPRWGEYPLKVEVAGAAGQFLGNIGIAVERDGANVVEFVCGGPWILARLEPGAYNVSATFGGLSTSGRVNVPAAGQGRLILRFPEADGVVSPEYTPQL